VKAVVLLLAIAGSAHAAPRDFTAEIHALSVTAACSDTPLTDYDAGVVKAHCAQVAKITGTWKKEWRDKAAPFFADLLKAGYPSTVVYPFGGGDLATMLTVFPDAAEYTSLSLEGMGDPRPILALGGTDKKAARAQRLSDGLANLRRVLGQNMNWAWNTTNQLSVDSSTTGIGTNIPNILAIALVHLDAAGYEPIEARYFTLTADGSVEYLTQERIDAWDAERAKQKASNKVKTNKEVQLGLFNDIEITFRKKGDAKAPKKTFRHLAADLSDAGIDADRSAYAYIDRRKDFSSMTKASSYLLWKPIEFDKIHQVLLARMKLMVSDDTGFPPSLAQPAGFTQKVYGQYSGPFFRFPAKPAGKEMVELWKNSLSPTVPFRFGYYDNRRRSHVLFTYK
jgi:hypothetical protein